jgi:ABC-type Na+ efflux pump permease subunit
VRQISSPVVIVFLRELRSYARQHRTMAILVVLSIFLANAGYAVVTLSPLVHLSIVSRHVGGVDLSGSQELARSMLIWIGILPLLFSAQQAAITIAGERERRSLTALLASPVPTSSILLGKLAGSLAPGLVMLGVAYGFYFVRIASSSGGGVSWLTVPYVLAIIGLVLVFSLLMNSLALIVSSLAPTVAASSITATFVLLPVTMVLAVVSVNVSDLGTGGLHAITALAAAATCVVLAYVMRALGRERLLTV